MDAFQRKWRLSISIVTFGGFGPEYSEDSDHCYSLWNGRPIGAQADSGARRAGGAARPRDCRALRAAIAWGCGLCAAGGHGRGHPRFQAPPIVDRPPHPSEACALGALRFRDKTPKCPFVRRNPRSSPACSCTPAGFGSLIVADFPALFAEFRRKQLTSNFKNQDENGRWLCFNNFGHIS
jgi:hypothetical protein